MEQMVLGTGQALIPEHRTIASRIGVNQIDRVRILMVNETQLPEGSKGNRTGLVRSDKECLQPDRRSALQRVNRAAMTPLPFQALPVEPRTVLRRTAGISIQGPGRVFLRF